MRVLCITRASASSLLMTVCALEHQSRLWLCHQPVCDRRTVARERLHRASQSSCSASLPLIQFLAAQNWCQAVQHKTWRLSGCSAMNRRTYTMPMHTIIYTFGDPRRPRLPKLRKCLRETWSVVVQVPRRCKDVDTSDLPWVDAGELKAHLKMSGRQRRDALENL
jgi:hypothetical protein